MLGLLDPVFKENYLGRAEVLNVFKITKVGQIAGCQVTDGLIRRDAQVRVLRDGEEVWKGKIASLKRVKEDVAEALKSGHLNGYGGDVWFPQPAPKDHPLRYAKNVLPEV